MCPIGDGVIVYLKNGLNITETCPIVVNCDACDAITFRIINEFPLVPTGTAVNLIDCIPTSGNDIDY